MKLGAIYNVWDGCELLKGSMACMQKEVDCYAIVYQDVSNFGEAYDPYEEIMEAIPIGKTVKLIKFTPTIWTGFGNEIQKRNIGIDVLREMECTHFLHVDVDEYYECFSATVFEYMKEGLPGSVCPIYTYFRKPTWRLENLDGYFVPFIHELRPDTIAGGSGRYPFYCDPTRVINQNQVAKLESPMHHFSWVRKDIERKARNSSAGQHGNKLQGLLLDYHSAELLNSPEGYVIKDMGGQKIKVVPNLFGIIE